MVADTTITRILTGAESASGMKAGDLISFISYVTQILISLMMISFLFLMFVRSKASAERVFEVMDTESTIKDPENPVMEVKDGSIVFNNVSFRYEEGKGEDTLSGINLSIASGENIGIIGATGSAKSTLVQLIPRLYDVIQEKFCRWSQCKRVLLEKFKRCRGNGFAEEHPIFGNCKRQYEMG